MHSDKIIWCEPQAHIIFLGDSHPVSGAALWDFPNRFLLFMGCNIKIPTKAFANLCFTRAEIARSRSLCRSVD